MVAHSSSRAKADASGSPPRYCQAVCQRVIISHPIAMVGSLTRSLGSKGSALKHSKAMCIVIGTLMLAGGRLGLTEDSAIAPSADVLMSIAFTHWKRGAKPKDFAKVPTTEIVSVHLPDEPQWSPSLPNAGKEWVPSRESSTVVATPIAVAQFDGEHAVLLTKNTLVDGDEETTGTNCRRCTYIGAYFFSNGGTGWTLSKRIDAIAFTSYGPDKPDIRKWPGHGYVFSFLDGDYRQGAGADQVVLIGLQPNRALPLLVTSIDGENDEEAVPLSETGNQDKNGPDILCSTVLDPKYLVPKGVHFGEHVDCQEAAGAWRFDGDLVVFEFHGSRRHGDGRGGLQPLDQWRSTAALELRGDTLKLIKGSLPTFGF